MNREDRSKVSEILGIHHITAIAGDPQRNIEFYTGFLGLRLVMLTVDFDDPTTYHLFYGDGWNWPAGYNLDIFSLAIYAEGLSRQ